MQDEYIIDNGIHLYTADKENLIICNNFLMVCKCIPLPMNKAQLKQTCINLSLLESSQTDIYQCIINYMHESS